MILNTSNQERQKMLTTYNVTIWDQNKMSDRVAVTITGETVHSLGQEIYQPVLNRSIIRLQRLKHHITTAERIKYQFDSLFPLVHWNGELLTVITGTVSGSRSPVLVTNIGPAQLLAVPKLSSGTRETQAKAIFLF